MYFFKKKVRECQEKCLYGTEFSRIRMESKINSQINCQQLVGIMMCGDYF